MDFEKLFTGTIAKIHNQRFLFGSVGILAVLVLASFQITLSIAVLAAVVVIIGLDILATRHAGSGQLGMTLALTFSQSEELEDIQLGSATCRVYSPQNPDQKTTHRLMPYRGGGGQGWLCPIPNGVSARDVVEFTFVDSQGRSWVTDPTVPELLWPTIEVRRVSRTTDS